MNERKNLKLKGKLQLPQQLKVENINEEILKKGLEIGNITYTKSMYDKSGVNFFENPSLMDFDQAK